MKRCISMLLVLIMIVCSLSCAAEEAPATGFFTRLGIWLDGVVENAEETAGSAGDWLQEQWGEVKDGAANLAERSRQAAKSALNWGKERWADIWSDVKGFLSDIGEKASQKFQSLYQKLISFKTGITSIVNDYGVLKERIAFILARIVIKEIADIIEIRAAEMQVPIPEDVQDILDRMKNLRNDFYEKELDELSMQTLEDFLTQIGLDSDSLSEIAIEQLSEERVYQIFLTAESEALKEYMSEYSLRFTDDAELAQKQLDRYAAGELTMSQDQLKACAETITKWAELSGVDNMDLLDRTLKKLETY